MRANLKDGKIPHYGSIAEAKDRLRLVEKSIADTEAQLAEADARERDDAAWRDRAQASIRYLGKERVQLRLLISVEEVNED